MEQNLPATKKSIFKRWWFWVVIILVILIIVFLLVNKFVSQNSKKRIDSYITNNLPIDKEKKIEDEKIIKNLGFNLDYYNPETKKAGDIEFFRIKLPYDRLFTDYGDLIGFGERKEKNVHPTFILPIGTKVLATIDGVVSSVTKLYSGDYSIQFSVNGKEDGGLIYGLEHVKNPIVKIGERVAAGQPVAEVTDVSSDHFPGYGYFDLTVFSTTKSGQPQHHCPFLYLDNSIKESVNRKLSALYVSWEEYYGSNIYDENSNALPGCVSIDPIDG